MNRFFIILAFAVMVFGASVQAATLNLSGNASGFNVYFSDESNENLSVYVSQKDKDGLLKGVKQFNQNGRDYAQFTGAFDNADSTDVISAFAWNNNIQSAAEKTMVESHRIIGFETNLATDWAKLDFTYGTGGSIDFYLPGSSFATKYNLAPETKFIVNGVAVELNRANCEKYLKNNHTNII